MIPSGVEIFVGLAPIDLRWGFDRLSGIVEQELGRVARSGALFVFFGKRKSAVKVIFFDGSGLCMFYKRADKGNFRVPTTTQPDARSIELSEGEFDALLDAIDVEVSPAKRSRRKARVH
jgi:transposase